MPSRINADGTRTRISHEEAAAATQDHLDAMGRAGVTWDDLGDAPTMHQKISDYNRQGFDQVACTCRGCR